MWRLLRNPFLARSEGTRKYCWRPLGIASDTNKDGGKKDKDRAETLTGACPCCPHVPFHYDKKNEAFKGEKDKETIFAKRLSDKDLVTGIHKELLKLNSEKANDPVKKIGQRSELTPHPKKMTNKPGEKMLRIIGLGNCELARQSDTTTD